MLINDAMNKEHWSLSSLRPMTDEEFHLWQALIETRVGMTVGESRRSFLCTNLGVRMRELGLHDYDTYYERLVQGAGAASEPEWSVLVDRLTVQETSFFRHQPSFDCYGRFVADSIRDHRRNQLNIWSVGCSTGEEPYSLAMQLQVQLDASGRAQEIFWGITATDISLPTLAKGREAIYPVRRTEQVPEIWRKKFFLPCGKDRLQIIPELRAKVCFAQVNIMELAKAPFFDMDVVFCQNVLIYFKRFRKRDIVSHLVQKLTPGGILILGVNEMVDWQHPELERVRDPGVLAFRRRLST